MGENKSMSYGEFYEYFMSFARQCKDPNIFTAMLCSAMHTFAEAHNVKPEDYACYVADFMTAVHKDNAYEKYEQTVTESSEYDPGLEMDSYFNAEEE